jgi:hypothetical protein
VVKVLDFLDRNPAREGFFVIDESSNPGEGGDFVLGCVGVCAVSLMRGRGVRIGWIGRVESGVLGVFGFSEVSE